MLLWYDISLFHLTLMQPRINTFTLSHVSVFVFCSLPLCFYVYFWCVVCVLPALVCVIIARVCVSFCVLRLDDVIKDDNHSEHLCKLCWSGTRGHWLANWVELFRIINGVDPWLRSSELLHDWSPPMTMANWRCHVWLHSQGLQKLLMRRCFSSLWLTPAFVSRDGGVQCWEGFLISAYKDWFKNLQGLI